MPRIARAVAAEFPHHVVQRGNNKEKVFFEKEDRENYLSLLKKYSEGHKEGHHKESPQRGSSLYFYYINAIIFKNIKEQD